MSSDNRKVKLGNLRSASGGSKAADIIPFKNQNYEQLKQDCLRNKTLFEDPLFPTVGKSISYTAPPSYNVKWKRPNEIVKKPQEPKFIQDGASSADLDQGKLGNCWFIAGCAAIALDPDLFNKVVPPNQPITGSDYAGIFHFRFWIYGQWCDVVIDDRLPVEDDKLIFCRNKEEPNEFWAALLEKAYAKVAQSYENLDGGSTTDALIDMTGGIQETFQIKGMQTIKQNEQIWNLLIKSRKHKSLIGCSIAPNPRIREARLPNGLVMGHAYTVTKVACIERYGREIRLVRVRNPWGNDTEWHGSWCDSSYEWATVSQDVKQALGFRKLADGEFWMSFDDFYRNFETIELCNLTPDSFSDELAETDKDDDVTWKLTSYNDAWIPGKSSGGSGVDNAQAFWTNPQFLVSLKDVDKDDNEDMATVIISLMQKYTREKRFETKGEPAEEYIQFRLYKVINPADAEKVKKSGTRLYASQLERVGTSGSYINARDITKRYRVKPGDYIIIPSCYDQNVKGEFLLRIFTEVAIGESDAKVLEDHKDNLNDRDIFFSHSDIDNMFNDWTSLLGGDDAQPKERTLKQRSLNSSSSQNIDVVRTKTVTFQSNNRVNADNNKSKGNESTVGAFEYYDKKKVMKDPKAHKKNVKEACRTM